MTGLAQPARNLREDSQPFWPSSASRRKTSSFAIVHASMDGSGAPEVTWWPYIPEYRTRSVWRTAFVVLALAVLPAVAIVAVGLGWLLWLPDTHSGPVEQAALSSWRQAPRPAPLDGVSGAPPLVPLTTARAPLLPPAATRPPTLAPLASANRIIAPTGGTGTAEREARRSFTLDVNRCCQDAVAYGARVLGGVRKQATTALLRLYGTLHTRAGSPAGAVAAGPTATPPAVPQAAGAQVHAAAGQDATSQARMSQEGTSQRSANQEVTSAMPAPSAPPAAPWRDSVALPDPAAPAVSRASGPPERQVLLEAPPEVRPVPRGPDKDQAVDTVPNPGQTRIVLRYVAGRGEVERRLAAIRETVLRQGSSMTMRPDLPASASLTVVRYYYRNDRDAAEWIAKLLGASRIVEWPRAGRASPAIPGEVEVSLAH